MIDWADHYRARDSSHLTSGCNIGHCALCTAQYRALCTVHCTLLNIGHCSLCTAHCSIYGIVHCALLNVGTGWNCIALLCSWEFLPWLWYCITLQRLTFSLSPNVAHHHCQTCSAIQHSDDVDQCDEVLLHVTTQRKELKHEVDALYSPDSMWNSNKICAMPDQCVCNGSVVCECTGHTVLAAPSPTIRAAGQIWPNISHNAVTLADVPLNDHHDHLSLIDDTPNQFNDKHCKGKTNLLMLLFYKS